MWHFIRACFSGEHWMTHVIGSGGFMDVTSLLIIHHDEWQLLC